ncbi:MAG: D-tyrosyl-tRNA(Tyr) deacylase [Ignavibacteria bacterium]|nr:D-tyrosyl-tRNA(Tyr) deacylase [Ignavibacteria bacterium]
MIALIQRVLESNVTVNAELIDSMRGGLLIFLGINSDETENDARYLAAKTANLRIFSDSEDKMNLSLLDNSLDAMVISQFTLHADTRHGNRPSFTEAAEPDRANELYMMFIEEMKMLIGNDKVHRGEFGAMMKVKLVNDGPVTIILRSKNDY